MNALQVKKVKKCVSSPHAEPYLSVGVHTHRTADGAWNRPGHPTETEVRTV